MNPISDPAGTERCKHILARMMLAGEDATEFRPEWVRRQGWKVVPVKQGARIPSGDVSRLVSVLEGAGYRKALVITTEPLGDFAPPYYTLPVDEASFLEFNRQLGLFRSLITPEDLEWAISCTESYNLFAARPELLEQLLGKPIDQARHEYFAHALALAASDDDPLVRMARHYASL